MTWRKELGMRDLHHNCTFRSAFIHSVSNFLFYKLLQPLHCGAIS